MNQMIDMSRFVEAKSDQLNADDLIGSPRTITVTKVTGSDGDQPISIFYEGDNGKPFKPCKTIRRVLMAIWGRYANEYVGRSMTIYRDDKVTFGGLETGGIRISHMSHMEKETVVVVMKTKGKKAGVKVLPLTDAKPASSNGRGKVESWANQLVATINNASEPRDVEALLTKHAENLAKLRSGHPDLAKLVDDAVSAKQRKPASEDADPFAEGPADNQRGEAFTTVDAEADILDHLSRKTTVIDVNSLIASRLGELDDDAQQRVRDAANARIEELRAA